MLGSAELRANFGRVKGGLDRMQLYGFVDSRSAASLRLGIGNR